MWRDFMETTMFIYDFSHAIKSPTENQSTSTNIKVPYSGTIHYAAGEIYKNLSGYHPRYNHDWESLIKVIFLFI